jgi:hypothetical protein
MQAPDPSEPSLRLRAPLLVLAGVALALMAPSLLWGPGPRDSGVLDYVWVKQFAAGLGQGELYPRWLPQSFQGLGSPTFYFYPPLAFYLAGLLDLAGLSTLQAINAAALALLFLSGATMFLWLRGKTRFALAGACLYMAAPYHLNDLYARAAFAEFAAYLWPPLIALCIEAQPRRWAGPGLAFSYAGLIATHLPLAMLESFLLIAPLVAWTAWRRRSPAFAAHCALGLAAGVALAMAYLLPALSLQGHVSIRSMFGPYFQPSNWSILHPAGGVRIPLLHAYAWLAAAAAILALAATRRRAPFWPALACGLAVLSLGLPAAFWALPLIHKAQFPWRCLAIVEFAAVTAMAHAPPRKLALALAALVAAPGVAFLCGDARDSLMRPFPGRLDQAMADAAEYLPPGITRAQALARQGRFAPAAFHGALARGPARVRPGERGGLVVEAREPGVVTLRRAAFPIWRVVRNGRTVPALPGPMLAFQVRPGRYDVQRVILPQERLGAMISLAALPLILGLALRPRRRRAAAAAAAPQPAQAARA